MQLDAAQLDQQDDQQKTGKEAQSEQHTQSDRPVH
jgi:hypothetical protein